MKNIKFLWVLAALLLPASVHAEGSRSAKEISQILFPETKAWQEFDALPKLTPQSLSAIRGQLLRALNASKHGKELVEKCGIEESSLSELIGSFRVVDLDKDGIADVVYGGADVCNEGSRTILWFGTKSGYELRDGLLWRLMPLRLQRGSPPKFSAVAIGCCADPVDEYTLGNFESMRINGVIRITKDTVIPSAQPFSKPKMFVSRKETALRSDSSRKDAYDKDLSELFAHAVFGNIVAKFLPGLRGEILAEQKDTQGRNWMFVKAGPESSQLQHHAPFKVNVGWMEK